MEDTMTYTQIALDIDGPIATITLDRPEKLNAFTGVMMTEMIAAFDETDANDQVKAVIVTGRGRAFCAGADLSAGAATFDYEKLGGARSANPMREDGSIDWTHPATRDGGGQVTMRIFRSLKPVIAAVNGPAVGIGATMQLAMDMRLASDTARFGFVFARRGIVPEAGSSWFLSKLVGLPQALEWCMRRMICCRPPALWRWKLPRTLRRFPSHSPGRCCGAWPAPPARGTRTGWIQRWSTCAVALAMPRKALSVSWRSAHPPILTR
jgi:enoyl-CoA hydratase/carnithine racemase